MPNKKEKIFIKNLHEKYRLIYYIGKMTGLRIGDILDIKPQKIKGLYLSLVEHKTKKRRKIKLELWLVSVIRRYVKKNNIKETSKIFDVSRQAVWKEFKSVAKKMHLRKNIGTHSMRKKCAKNVYRATKSVGEVAKKLNHENENVSMTYLFE